MPSILSRLFNGTSNVLPETSDSFHVMQYSLNVQSVEGRVNLDPWILVGFF